jgi:hypothetical protein
MASNFTKEDIERYKRVKEEVNRILKAGGKSEFKDFRFEDVKFTPTDFFKKNVEPKTVYAATSYDTFKFEGYARDFKPIKPARAFEEVPNFYDEISEIPEARFARFQPLALSRPERPQLPVTVHAPIVLNALTGARPLLDFVESLKYNSNVDVAKAEVERLAPYMAGLSLYLTEAMASLDPASDAAREKDTLQSLTTPGALSGLFTAMARCTCNTILSEVAIAPDNIKLTGPASSLFGSEFNSNYNYRGHRCNFGFLQVYEAGVGASYSTTLPIFLLDRGMMDAIAPHTPEAMLRDFQRVMTLVNHDMLHHFTTPIINNSTANTFGNRPNNAIFSDWRDTLPSAGSLNNFYEAWAQVAHEKVLLSPGNHRDTGEIIQSMERFFNELERIRDAMAQDGTPESAERARETTDYYGMMMAHALTRAYPLDHLVMDYCFERMGTLDTMPERTLKDCSETFLFGHESLGPDASDYDRLNALRKKIGRTTITKQIVDTYRHQGLELLPRDDNSITYKGLKLLQLVDFSEGEIFTHMPDPTDPAMAETRDKAAEATLGMVLAAAKTADFTPPSGMP